MSPAVLSAVADAGDAGEAGHVTGVERLVELVAHTHQLLQVLDAPCASIERSASSSAR